jgi:hypothetical protein
MKNKIVVGQKFGRLTVLFEAYVRNRAKYWFCLCDCGNTKVIRTGNLKSGTSKSCGCLQKELLSEKKATHKMSHSGTYRSWKSMKARCNNPNSPKYKSYGGRGITVCDRWINSFEDFLEDMGERPSRKYSIERKNNNGNYEPENCIWLLKGKQQRNMRTTVFITYNNRTQCRADWAEELGIKHSTLAGRLRRGWNVDKAFNTPVG